ncbi:MAG: hypothetical protein GY950_06350 [bacterium]|nr:hypothetical protein [bacterium]
MLIFTFLLTGCGGGKGDAVEAGDLEAVRLMLEKKPKAVHNFDDDGYTLLHRAARAGQTGISELLLDRGADMNASDRRVVKGPSYRRFTALCFAVYNGHDDAAKLLISRGAELDPTVKVTHSPLYLAVTTGNKGLARLLLEKGADVNGTRGGRATPLYRAIYRGDPGMARLLLENGANVNWKAYRQLTPLHWTVYWEKAHPEIARILIEKGAKVDAKTEDKYTPLHFAAVHGYKECAALLLENGASIHARNFWGSTPVVSAQKGAAQVLLSLHTAAAKGDTAEVKSLLQKYPQLVEARDIEGKTPLHYAVESNRVTAAELLIAGGADIKAVSRFKRVELLHGAIAKILVPRGGRVKWLKHEKKPLDIAVQKGYAQMAQLLKENGAAE